MSLSIRQYKPNECITFKSTKGEFGALSNMAPNFPIYINQVMFKNSEALYQSLRFPYNPEVQKKIIFHNSPITAKKVSREYIHLTRGDWNLVRFKIMKLCIELKLYQNFDKFSNVLLATKDYPIVEYSDKDKVWGATFQDGYYIGTNALGRYLMELREKIKSNDFKIFIPEIDNLLIDNQLITIDSIIKFPINKNLEQGSLFN